MHRTLKVFGIVLILAVAFSAGAYFDAIGAVDFSSVSGSVQPTVEGAATGVVVRRTKFSLFLKYADGSVHRFAILPQTPVIVYERQVAVPEQNLTVGSQVTISVASDGSAAIVALVPGTPNPTP